MLSAAMRDIYDRLSQVGFDRKFVRDCILPEWWDDKLADVPAERAYAEAIISRQLGIDMSCLRDKNCELETRLRLPTRFKHRRGIGDKEYKVAGMLGWRLAKLASQCLQRPTSVADLNAAAIRGHILASGAPWVDLENLLGYCWSIGIPVVRLCPLPRGAKRMAGMAVWPERHPVIVIGSARRQPAWHLFIVAHELGHIVPGHVQQGEGRVDDKVELEFSEKAEAKANEFAVELLTGDPYLYIKPPSRPLSSSELADAAKSLGSRMAIDPGFVALNYSWTEGSFDVGSSALNELNPGGTAHPLYNKFYSNLNLDELAEDNQHLFECLTGAGT
ncbi:MAG TPA: ImmA/IrrE family metallo-endopeptidase [Armatimonadota bacterium]|nr:ImmA/IrrE family metallo-endopeptidase [Armatimonadota bacterium]